MAILTSQEAADALGYVTTDEMPSKVESIFLPAVDEFLTSATGKDWGTLTTDYTAIDPMAKMAAAVLLIKWFDNPDDFGKGGDFITAMITQLKSKYLQETAAAS